MKFNPELPGPVDRPEPKGGGDPTVAGPPRRRSSKAVLYVILSLVFFGSLIRLLPTHSVCLGRLRSTKPRTIEERVEHILRATPLIGNLPRRPHDAIVSGLHH